VDDAGPAIRGAARHNPSGGTSTPWRSISVSTALVGDVPTALTALFLRRERFRRDFARREWKGTADPNSVASLAREPSRGRIRARLL